MATATGSTVSGAWRAYMDYSTTSDEKFAYISVTSAGMQSVNWGFQIATGIYHSLGYNDPSGANPTGDQSYANSDNNSFYSATGETKKTSYNTGTMTFGRQHSAYNVTIYSYVWNHSGYLNGESKATYILTVPAKSSYTVAYNANGGSGAPSSQTKWYGENLTLSSTKPTRTGYSFQGWATSSGGSVAYYAGGSYTSNAAITLYAVWKANTYTVAYNANGGSGAPGSQTKTYGVTLTLSSTKPTRTGYSFQGWATSSGGSVAYSAGGSYTANAAVTLYAVWKANTYTISFNANGGSGAPSAVTKTYGVTLTLPTTVPTRTNYAFLGWSTSSTAVSATYSAGGSYTANSAATLYAVWKLTYTKPSIYLVQADRCDSTGALDNMGTYASVEFHWSCDQNAGSNPVMEISVGYRLYNSGTDYTWIYAIYPDGTSEETSGSYERANGNAIIIGDGNLSIENRYDIYIYVSDTITHTSNPARFYLDLYQAAFILDFKKGGTGIAIGKPADLDDTFEIAKRTIISRGDDVDTSFTPSGFLTIGDPNGLHLSLDDNEIQAKTDGFTAGSLLLQQGGGDTGVGGNLVVSGVIKGDSSTAGVKISNSSEMNFTSNENVFYFGYSNRGGSSVAVDTYRFGNHNGSSGQYLGNIQCGTLALYGTGDAAGTAAGAPALVTGPTSGTHIAIDGNEIVAKNNATTPGTLYLGAGGSVYLCGDSNYSTGPFAVQNGHVYLSNGYCLYVNNSSGTSRMLAGLNSSNQYHFGHGSYYYNEGSSLYYGNTVGIISKGAVNITSPTAGLSARAYGVNKVLATTVSYMNANQTISLSEAVSAQPHGIILAWSAYVSGAAGNYDWAYHFVPKYHVSAHAGNGINMPMFTADFAHAGSKYVYVGNTSITGWSGNETDSFLSDIDYDNNYWVLRYVIGV